MNNREYEFFPVSDHDHVSDKTRREVHETRVTYDRPPVRYTNRKNTPQLNRRFAAAVAALLAVILIFSLSFRACRNSREREPSVGLGKAAPTEPIEVKDGLTVCLDAGHGGKDTGAIGEGDRYEKTDDLRLTLAAGRLLSNWGVKVVYTRDKDIYRSLDFRSRFANENKVDLFVSIHRNSAASKTVSGVEAWVNKTMPKEDIKLAENLLHEIEVVGYGENRGVRGGYQGNSSANYAVNADTEMPSVLIEMGFITTKEDNELFDELFDYYAYAIAAGIAKTLNDLN